MPDRYTVVEAARYTGSSTSWLNKARVLGGGPTFIKIGRKVVYDSADLDAWINGRRRSSTSQAEVA